MKKLMLSFAAVVLTSLLLISSCKKGTDPLPKEDDAVAAGTKNARSQQMRENEGGDAQTYFAAYGPQPQTFIIDPKQDRTIVLQQGTQITVPAGAFMLNGQVVTGGLVRLDVLELPDRGAMARRGINTMSDNDILESDGSFFFTPTVNGVPADRELAPGRSLRMRVPDWQPSDRPTSLFTGTTTSVPAGNGQLQFNWLPTQDPSQGQVVANINSSFSFETQVLNPINCDLPWPRPWQLATRTTGTTITVDLPNNPGAVAGYQGSGGANTYVLLAPQGANVLVQLYTPNGNNQVSSLPNSIPVGINARLLAYSVVNGNYYIAQKDITTTAGMTESLTFAPSNAAALTAALNALNSY